MAFSPYKDHPAIGLPPLWEASKHPNGDPIRSPHLGENPSLAVPKPRKSALRCSSAGHPMVSTCFKSHFLQFPPVGYSAAYVFRAPFCCTFPSNAVLKLPLVWFKISPKNYSFCPSFHSPPILRSRSCTFSHHEI